MAGCACLLHAVSAAAAGAAGAAAPSFARSVVLRPVSGQVLIHLRVGPAGFIPLLARRVVPVGTIVDTTAGRVSLTSAVPEAARTQTGEFFRGIFRIEQPKSAAGLVNLVLRDNLPRSVCRRVKAHPAALGSRILGLLRGTAKGRFRTTGRFAAATVRGTDWGVRDRCDGTLTVVRRGTVVVHDFRLGIDVVVRAGQTYLAKAS